MDGDLASMALLMKSIDRQCLTILCITSMSVPATVTEHMARIPERAPKETVPSHTWGFMRATGTCKPQVHIEICRNVDFASATLSWYHAQVTLSEWWWSPMNYTVEGWWTAFIWPVSHQRTRGQRGVLTSFGNGASVTSITGKEKIITES